MYKGKGDEDVCQFRAGGTDTTSDKSAC
jgi:hypothetical protein